MQKLEMSTDGILNKLMVADLVVTLCSLLGVFLSAEG